MHRDNGTLLTEEVMGFEGFSGLESILYHLQSPCRVIECGEFEPIVREEWVPDAHAHRHLTTWDVPPGGDAVTGRQLLMWNNDVEISLCAPDREMDYFFRNGEGDEVDLRARGQRARSRRSSATCRTSPATTSSSRAARRTASAPEGEQRYLVFETPGLITIPKRYRNEHGQLMEHAPYYHRDIHAPTELHTHRDRGEYVVKVRVRGGYQTYVIDYHPFDVVGWDGYVYPWTFSIHDFEPITGRIHMPPPSHQTFAGPNFVICSFCPRKLDFDPEAIPIPYHHSNLQSEEMIYYVDGNFSSRKGIEVGSVTLHPSGLPHGPQPGLAEKSLGMTETHEYAVMCDTFNPLRLTTLAADLDDGKYMYSWAEDAVVERPHARRRSRRRHLASLDAARPRLGRHLHGAATRSWPRSTRSATRRSTTREYASTTARRWRPRSARCVCTADEAARWAVENVELRAGLPRARRGATDPVIVSSGLPQLILPVLEREGVELEVRSNYAEPAPDGWRVSFRDDGPCPVCGDRCKRRSLPAERPLVFVGDG